jgi:hypothetical protein
MNHNLPYKWFPVLLMSASLVACSSNTSTDSLSVAQPSAAVTQTAAASTVGTAAVTANPVTSDMVSYDADDAYTDWTKEKPNYIELKGTTAILTGTGAMIENNTINVLLPGVYVISGELTDGQIIVDSQRDGTVKLVLNGAKISSSTTAPIFVKNADKTIVSLPEGTQNVLSDAKTYVYADKDTDEPNAALYSKDDLTINGSGSLTVYGNYNNAITGKDDLKITSGQLEIHSVDDGIIGRDMLAVKDGTITIDAEGDGIRSTNDTDASKGFIALAGGTHNIRSGGDAIQAVGSVLITGGQYTLSTGGGSANGTVKMEDNRQGPGMGGQNGAATTTAAAATDAKSAKGIKAAADLTITGGTFSIDSSDDAIHSNGSIAISGGEAAISSGDDGIHADSSILIKDGLIRITKSYEGIESQQITLAGGEIHVTATDDGINVGGGNDGSSVGGRPGQNSFNTSTNMLLNITGGYVTVDAAGDGLDSNGSITMSGGTVLVNGPTNNGNGSLDYDGTFTMSGGVLIAAGSSGMAQATSEQSAQYSVMMSFSTAQKAGTPVVLKDSSGNIVAAYAPSKQYQTVVISSPDLKKDGAYTLYSGGTWSGSTTDGLYTDGTYDGGTKVVDFTTASPVTYLSESGVTTGRASGGMGGGRGGQGQMQGGQAPSQGQGQTQR